MPTSNFANDANREHRRPRRTVHDDLMFEEQDAVGHGDERAADSRCGDWGKLEGREVLKIRIRG
jgi:hypothetical protein